MVCQCGASHSQWSSGSRGLHWRLGCIGSASHAIHGTVGLVVGSSDRLLAVSAPGPGRQVSPLFASMHALPIGLAN